MARRQQKKSRFPQRCADDLLRSIEEYIALHGYPPSYREMQEALGVSLGRVKELYDELYDSGCIATDLPKRGAPRAYRVVTGTMMTFIGNITGRK